MGVIYLMQSESAAAVVHPSYPCRIFTCHVGAYHHRIIEKSYMNDRRQFLPFVSNKKKGQTLLTNKSKTQSKVGKVIAPD